MLPPPSISVDLNFDGIIDRADWMLFRPNLLADLSGLSPYEGYLLGDFDFDGKINYIDFAIFKAEFENHHGAGSFARLAKPVPEVASLSIAALAVVTWKAFHRRTPPADSTGDGAGE